jgi:hypothetical protein
VRIVSNAVLIILTFGWVWILIQLLARRPGSPEPMEPLDEVDEER